MKFNRQWKDVDTGINVYIMGDTIVDVYFIFIQASQMPGVNNVNKRNFKRGEITNIIKLEIAE